MDDKDKDKEREEREERSRKAVSASTGVIVAAIYAARPVVYITNRRRPKDRPT